MAFTLAVVCPFAFFLPAATVGDSLEVKLVVSVMNDITPRWDILRCLYLCSEKLLLNFECKNKFRFACVVLVNNLDKTFRCWQHVGTTRLPTPRPNNCLSMAATTNEVTTRGVSRTTISRISKVTSLLCRNTAPNQSDFAYGMYRDGSFSCNSLPLYLLPPSRHHRGLSRGQAHGFSLKSCSGIVKMLILSNPSLCSSHLSRCTWVALELPHERCDRANSECLVNILWSFKLRHFI